MALSLAQAVSVFTALTTSSKLPLPAVVRMLSLAAGIVTLSLGGSVCYLIPFLFKFLRVGTQFTRKTPDTYNFQGMWKHQGIKEYTSVFKKKCMYFLCRIW